jgi:hypothetical protein
VVYKKRMARKEHKGGQLTNEEIEKELQRTSGDDKSGYGYRGSQDTGDSTVRGLGTDVQQEDGRPPEKLDDDQ